VGIILSLLINSALILSAAVCEIEILSGRLLRAVVFYNVLWATRREENYSGSSRFLQCVRYWHMARHILAHTGCMCACMPSLCEYIVIYVCDATTPQKTLMCSPDCTVKRLAGLAAGLNFFSLSLARQRAPTPNSIQSGERFLCNNSCTSKKGKAIMC
jgi:hypothetical protein